MAGAGAELLDRVSRLAALPPDAFAAVCDEEAAGLGLPPDHLAAAVELARSSPRRNGAAARSRPSPSRRGH